MQELLTRVAIDPSRELIFSPDWGGQSVIFDALSGDFWIVGEDARLLLQKIASSLNDGDALRLEDFGSAESELLAQLQQYDIIQLSIPG